MAILKVNKKDIIYFLLVFIISIAFISWGIVGFFLKECPNDKEALVKSKISQVEFTLALYGKHLPDNKVKVYNTLVDKSSQFDYTNDNLKAYKVMWALGVIPSLVLTAILFGPYLLIKDKIKIRKIIKQEALLKGNYMKKYSLNSKVTRVRCFDGTALNKQIINNLLVYWIENDAIYFINNDFHNDLGLFSIQFNDIICFSRYGDFYTSMNIDGGDSSFGKAALGYLIAGPAGAIIASRNSINSETVVHDKRETLLFIKENNKEKYIFFDPKFYDALMHVLPSKEINIMAKKGKEHEEINDKFEKIKKLGELKEKGYIDESEFIKLKNQLI